MSSLQVFSQCIRSVALVAIGAGVAACVTMPERSGEGIDAGKGCALSQCVPMVLPPQLTEAGGLKRVAILPVRSVDGVSGSDQIAAYLESELSKVRLNEALYYTIVPATDRSRHATFEITSTSWEATSSDSTEQRTRCNDKLNALEKLDPTRKCKSSSSYLVNCSVHRGSVAATFRLRSPDGSALATRQQTGISEIKACPDKGKAIVSNSEVMGGAVSNLVKQIQDVLALRTKMVQVRVKDDVAEISDANRRTRFQGALEFYKAGRLDRACPVFEELTEIENRSVSVYFNAGFCAQVAGDWKKANALYRLADGLTRSPDKQLRDSLIETTPNSNQPKLVN
jgi:tetratricopeptide (TPR) repeat protein